MIYLISNQTRIWNNPDIQPATVQDCLDYFKDKDEIGYDSETTGLDCFLHKLFTFQLGDYDNQFVIDYLTIDIQEFRELLESKLLLAHNMKFDIKFLYRQGIVPKKVFCTYLAEKVLTTGLIGFSASLQAVAKRHLDVWIDKTVRGLIFREGLSDRVVKYAADDTKYLSLIKEHQLDLARKENLLNTISLENSFVRVLAYIEYSGFKLDTIKWQLKCDEDTLAFQKIEKELNDWIINNNKTKYIDKQLDLFSTETKVSLNWSSPKQVIELFEELGLELDIPDKKTGEMKKSTDAKILNPQKDKSDIIPIFLKYKEYQKETTTYGANFYKHISPITERLHTQFNQIMDTGRLSSGGKDKVNKLEFINFQNIPSAERTRSCFIADKGNILIVADYSGQETVLLAELSRDKTYSDYINDPEKDLHSLVTTLVYPELAQFTHNEIKKHYSAQRTFVKPGTFCIPYGGSGWTIANNLKISNEDGDRVYNGIMDIFPGLKTYFTKIKKQVLRQGYVLINKISGRKSYINDFKNYQRLKINYNSLNSKERIEYTKLKGSIERAALNYPLQGTGADMTKLAGIKFFNYLEANNLLFKVWMPNIIHDEAIAESPIEIAEEIAKILKKCMEDAGNVFCKTVSLTAKPCITTHWHH